MSALGHSRPSHFVPVLNNVRYASDSDHSRYESELTLWAKADIHGPIRSHLDTRNGNQRSISPNTTSREPSIAGTSASMCPRVKKSIAAKCGYDGARILHLYGWLVPSETR